MAVDRDGVLWIVDALLYLGEGGHGDDIEEWRLNHRLLVRRRMPRLY